MGIIEKLEILIQERGFTQGEVERLAGLAASRISKWKDGRGEPTARQALRLARLLDVPMEYLVDDLAEGPAQQPHLTDAELRAVEITRALGLSVGQVIVGLHHAAGHPAPGADAADPQITYAESTGPHAGRKVPRFSKGSGRTGSQGA